MGRASPIVNSFNAGEFSPRLDGRQDIAKYAAACRVLEGFIPLIQGPAQRRGGFRYVAEVKDSGARTWLVRFEFNTTQAYQLEFGNHYIRFFANHGQVIDPMSGTPYEIASPYSTADLTDTDGSFRLRFVESADVMYFAHPSYAPRKLSRLGATNWTLTVMQPSGGPFKPENITATTVYASAATGAVTLTASAPLFSAQNVGSLFQLSQKSIIDVKSWEAGKAITTGDLRRSDGKNYKALNTATTGGDKPTHDSGAQYDGDTGVQWAYQDPGFGCVLITGFTDTTHVTGTVISPFPGNPTSQLPANAVGSANASARWNLAAWSDIEGWPSQVSFYRGRLAFGRQQTAWLSVAGDYETFTAQDQSGLVTTDMAITTQLQSSKVNNMQWMEANSSSIDALVCGTAGSEFVIKSMTENSPFGTDNNDAVMISTLGSHNAAPVHIGNVLLFIQRAGSKLRDVTYDFYSNQFQSVDQSVLAEHIPKVGINQIVYQQEPYSLIWGARVDGLLVCMTYSREQYPDAPHGGWHRHPVGGSGFVEAMSVTPAPDSSRDELWTITKRTINGVTKRYVEFMEWERRPDDDPQDQFYVDAGLTLNNTINATLTSGASALVPHATDVLFVAGASVFAGSDVGRSIHYRYSYNAVDTDGNEVLKFATAKALITSFIDAKNVLCTIDEPFPSAPSLPALGWRLTVTAISGLGHLEGETVDILVDGASHPQRVVTGGTIALQQPASKVQVGLGFSSKLQTMRLNVGAQDGTTQGKKARINQAVLRLLETASLKYGIRFSDMFDVDFRTAYMQMDNPPDLFTGDVLLDWPGEYDTNPWLCFSVDQPMAATIVSLMPQISASDRG